MAKIVKATALRNHLADVLKEVFNKEKFLFVSNRGKLVSVLVNIDFFEDLIMNASSEYLESIKEAREEYEKGEIFTEEEIFGDI
ncbi:MAG: type II toxin-antitoxin system prevent-host-death family antitoxin [Armatimonadota bacterium]